MSRYKEMKYEDYLKTSHWKSVREKRKELDGHQCFICGSTRELNVHHLSYERLGAENIETDMVTLCHGCHATLHRIKDQTKEELQRAIETGLEVRWEFLKQKLQSLLVIELWVRDIGNGGDLKVFDTGMGMVSRLSHVLGLIYPKIRLTHLADDTKEALVMIRHAKICELYLSGGDSLWNS